MQINRSTSAPRYLDYVAHYGLIDRATNIVPPELNHLVQTAIRIPTFQRGIAWGAEEVFDFIGSKSGLLGHVLITQVTQNQHRDLIDGLQRFATGTALLNSLFPLVLNTNPVFANHQVLFAILSAHVSVYWPVLQHNHGALCTHHRDAIKDQYKKFFEELDAELRKIFSRNDVVEIQAFSESIVRLFLYRQIAIDDFSGFRSLAEAINTFIGINTIRLELGTVDILRTTIVEKAESAPTHWSAREIENAENGITETFIEQGSPRKEILPLATVCEGILRTPDAHLILPNWDTGSRTYELDLFLSFVDLAVKTISSNKYSSEIAASGALPFSILVLQYFSEYMKGPSGTYPPFIAAGSTVDNPILHRYLRATYRALLAGSIGQLGSIADRAAKGSYTTLDDVADAINATTGAGALNQPPTAGWLRAQLQNVNKEKAKRIFNACLLPLATALGSTFSPVKFGRGANDWSIDHLIPSGQLNRLRPGYTQGQRITNFAPIPNANSRAAGKLSCSAKLSAGGLYSQTHPPHPYVTWLTGAVVLPAELDDQLLLEPNATPNVGDLRIIELEAQLNVRL